MALETLLIIGGGLIGSSLARAAKSFGGIKTVYMSDSSADVCAAIEKLGFADGVSEGQADYYASQADLVILCVPPGVMGEAAAKIIPSMKAGAILSDVGDLPETDILKKFWESLGSDVAIMTPERHDIVLATTSHVPHLIAYTLVGTAVNFAKTRDIRRRIVDAGQDSATPNFGRDD